MVGCELLLHDCLMTDVPTDERTRFLTDWLDYVLDLDGADDETQALESYAELRAWLVAQVMATGAIKIHRAVKIPDDVDPASYVGTTQDFGRFWTMDAGVAHNWTPGGDYGDVATPSSGAMHVLTARITDVAQIDLVETIACQLGSDWEREIRLAPGFLPVIEGALLQQRRNLEATM